MPNVRRWRGLACGLALAALLEQSGIGAGRLLTSPSERQWRRWLGPLNERQQQLICDWSRSFQPLGTMGVDTATAFAASCFDRPRSTVVLRLP